MRKMLSSGKYCDSEQAWRQREVMERTLSLSKLFPKLSEGSCVPVVSIHIVKKVRKGLQRIGIDSFMLFQTVFRTFLKILQIPVGLCHTDDGNRDSLVANQPQKSGKYLFVSEIATRTEENNCVR